MPLTYPIIYKMIPTQYAFLINSNGLIQIQQVTPQPPTKQFTSEQEAREYINNLTTIL
jgi:hypothetical protein